MNALPNTAIAASSVPAWHGCIFNGDWVPGNGGTAQIIEPATGKLLHEVGKADLADVAAAVALAKKRNVPGQPRRRVSALPCFTVPRS